jgi:hypothetical protein
MIGPLPTAPGGFNRVLVVIDKFTKWVKVKPVTCPKADRVLDFLDELATATDYPTASSQTWAPTSTITSSGNIARTTRSTSGMSQSPITGQRTSRVCQWDGTRHSEEATTRCCYHKGRQVDQGTTQCTVGALNSTYQANRAVTLLLGLRLRGYPTCRRHVGVAGSRAVRRRYLRRQQTS